MADIKQALRDFVDGEKKKKAQEKEARDLRNIEDRNAMIASIGADLAESLKPILAQLPESAKITSDQIKEALVSSIQVNIPEIDTSAIAEAVQQSVADAFSNLKFPEPKVNVSIPETKFPEFKFPETKFPEYMDVGLGNIKPKNALPVRLVDTDGKPFVFSFPSGSGGGKSDFFTVKGIQNTIGIVSINPDGSPAGAGSVASSVSVSDIFNTVGADVINPDGRIKVELPTGASGLTDTELRASSVPVAQASGALWSTTVYDVFQTTVASNVINPDNRVKVELPTGSSGLTDTELRATAVPVSQVSGASWSTQVFDVFATTVTQSVVNADNRVKVELPATTITAVTTVTSITNSVATVGNVASDVADNGDGPIKIGGIARQANPTAVAAGDRVSATFDDLGRQLIRPLQVRDLTLTAYASVSNGTETTLRSAVAGAYLDLIMLKLSNTSDAAVAVDIRSVTAGSIIDTIVVPPYGTAGYSLNVPWPQSDTGNNWTIDMPDITGTTVYATALFSQEV